MVKKSLFFIFCFAFILSCKNTVKDITPVLSLPQTLLMSGQAYSVDPEGCSCECKFEFIIELKSETERTDKYVEYEGTHGGGITRLVLGPDGSGIGLSPDVYGEIIVRYIFPDRLELEIPVNTDSESRFYRELSFFAGKIDEHANGSGQWTCAPFDINQGGYIDTSLFAYGDWTIRPLSGN